MAVTEYGPRETFVNNWTSTLNGSITAASTSVTVTDATGLPTSGYFRAVVESEIIRFDGRSGNVLSVLERGAEGTTAATHASATDIEVRLTAGALQKWFLEQRGCAFSEAGTPTSVPLGRHLAEDHSDLTVSDYTWLNQGSATASDITEGGVVMTLPKTDDSSAITARGLLRTAPATPFSVTVRVTMGPGGGDDAGSATGPAMGICLRESSTSKFVWLVCRYDWAQALWRFTNETTFSAIVDTNMKWESNSMWMRLTDDGTNIKGYFSVDGSNWTQDGSSWWQESRTAFMTGGPNQYGLLCSSGNMETGGLFLFDTIVVEEQ